jgi:AmiR/NasT family two-component response regulator
VPSHPKRVEGDIMGTTAELLAADRVLDEAWRRGVGVAKAVALAKELSEIILREVVIEDAKQIISAHHDCDAAEAFARIVFVSHRTNRSIRDLACLVVASAAAELQGLAVHPPHLYRFTL